MQADIALAVGEATCFDTADITAAGLGELMGQCFIAGKGQSQSLQGCSRSS